MEIDLLRSILEELKYQTKLLESVVGGKKDCGDSDKKTKAMQEQLYKTTVKMFKGTPMENKMKEMLKGITNGL